LGIEAGKECHERPYRAATHSTDRQRRNAACAAGHDGEGLIEAAIDGFGRGRPRSGAFS